MRKNPAPEERRRRSRGPIPILASVDGRPQVVRMTPSNDAQRLAIERHDKAVFAAVIHEDDTGLGEFARRAVIDAKTGTQYSFFVDPDALRDAADTGELELQDLYYSGGRRLDLGALPANGDPS